MADKTWAPFVPPERHLGHLCRALCLRWIGLEAGALERGFPIFLTEGWRSKERQLYLWSLGRTQTGEFIDPVKHRGVVTYAKPGESLHEQGRAIDVAFLRPKGKDIYVGPWDKLGALGVECGLVWGGNWPAPKTDRPHFQLPEDV